MTTLTAVDQLDVSFAVPDDADGLRELVTDTGKMGQIHAKHGVEGWALVNAAYQEAARRKDKDQLTEQMSVQMETRFHEMAQANGLEVTGGNLDINPKKLNAWLDSQARANRRGGQFYDDRAPGAAIDASGLFRDSGEALAAIWADSVPAYSKGLKNHAELVAKAGKIQEIQAAYSSHIGSSGGYLIPESFRTEMLQIAHEQAVVRANGPTVIPMSNPKVSIPAIHETDRTSGLFGGVTISWTEEDAVSTESNAEFKVIVLDPATMTGYTEIPNELLLDSMASGAYFNATFPRALAFEEDYAFLQGSGVGQPLGVLNAAAYIPVPLRDGQTGGVAYENVVDIYARMLPTSMGRAVWVINQDVIPELMTMGLVVGTGGGPMYQMNATSPMPMSLFGRPVVVTEKANALNTTGDISFIDFGHYLIGDLQTITITSSEHYKFPNRRTAFLIVSRVDGQPWLESAITPRHGSNTLSPFVGLTGTGRS